MLLKAHLVFLACLVTVAVTAPTSEPTTISSDCTELRHDFMYWLHANCLTSDGLTRHKSAVYLEPKITSKEGHLQWSKEGDKPYSNSCFQCALSGTILSCTCVFGDQHTETSLDLEEQIHNYGGVLLSTLLGPPVVPELATLPPPRDLIFAFVFPGEPDCYPPGSTCTLPIFMDSGKDCHFNDADIRGPIHQYGCQSFPNYNNTAPSLIQYAKAAFQGTDDKWEWWLYDNEVCGGEPFHKVLPPISGALECFSFEKPFASVLTMPLFNGDFSGGAK